MLMANFDERNFRSSYYEKVGFRNVEEKKSLEVLLKDKNLDRCKVKHFCLRFTVPATYRGFLWDLALGVLPIQLNLHDFIKEQHKQEFFDLLRGLKVMRTINSNTPKHQVLLAVWLLRTGNLHFDVNLSEECPFSLIAQCMIQFFEEEVETYWTAKCFYDIVRNFKMNTSKLIEISWGILEKEDPQLYKHLQMTRILYTLPLDRWFESAFACVIDASALAKMWDKLCGGSYKILVYFLIVLLTNQRHKLLKFSNVQDVLHCLYNISEEGADIIVSKSIDMWQQQGCPLTIFDKPKTT